MIDKNKIITSQHIEQHIDYKFDLYLDYHFDIFQ